MSGAKWFYISENTEIYEIPHPKDWVFKSISKLADKEVLSVHICYETINRKPERIIIINFDKIKLDSTGGYRISQDVIDKKMRNFIHFGFTTPEILSEREEPWSIPDAPILPNNIEIDTLKQLLKQKYPRLYKNYSQIIAEFIQDRKASHQNNIDLIKKAAILRNKKNTSQLQILSTIFL